MVFMDTKIAVQGLYPRTSIGWSVLELKPCNITDQGNMTEVMQTVLGLVSADRFYPKDFRKKRKYRFLSD